MSDVSKIALRLAEAHPEQLWPCPLCGAEVKGENLPKHLEKVHGGAGAIDATVRGSDHMILFWSILFAFLVIVGATVGLDVLGLMSRPVAGGVLVLLLVVSIPPVLAFQGKFPASITVSGSGMNFKRTLGGRQLTFPMKIETGAMVERRPSAVVGNSADYNNRYEDHHAGSYMRFIGANGGSVVVGAKRSTHPRKFWAFDEVQGAKRKRWDILMEPTELLKLQYLLSEHGVFSPCSKEP